jgi:hypothetical protein
MAHGITIIDMLRLVHAGLATAHAERVRTGNRVLEVGRLQITDSGLQTLAAVTRRG